MIPTTFQELCYKLKVSLDHIISLHKDHELFQHIYAKINTISIERSLRYR